MTGAIIALVLVAVFGVIGLILYRRRRARTSSDAPLPEIGEPIDYTSLPIEETVSVQERFANLPMTVKILIPVVVLLLLGAGVAVAVWPSGPPAPPPPSPTPIPEITITKALIDKAREPGSEVEIFVEADTTLRGGTTISGELLLDGTPFAWYDPESAVTQVQTSTSGVQNTIEMRLIKSFEEDVPDLVRVPGAYTYTIVLNAVGVNEPLEAASELAISPFVQQTPPELTTPTVTPTLTPTIENGEEEVETVEPVSTPEPELVVTVANGGRVRGSPEIVDNNIISDSGVIAGDTVTVLERTEDGWYRIRNPRNNIDGWVGGSLLDIDEATANQVPLQGAQNAPPEDEPAPDIAPAPVETPVEPTDVEPLPDDGPDTSAATSTGLFGTVANGGRVREAPNLDAREVDIINAGEEVELLAKNADGRWYQVTTERNVLGWTHISLLTMDQETIDQIPVQGADQSAPQPTPTQPVAAAPVANNVTAQVSMDGGYLYTEPDDTSELLQIIDGGSSVDVLLRTPDGRWYQVQVPPDSVVGWVSVSELFLSPGGDAALTQVPTIEVAEPSATPVIETQTSTVPENVTAPQQPEVGSAAPLASNACPESHPIKGTTTGEGEKLYILSFSGSAYDVTPPEICFATERDAQESGYRMYVPGNEY